MDAVRIKRFDFSAFAGFPVTLNDVPGLHCSGCGGETLTGVVINQALQAVACACIMVTHRLTAELARYVRRSLDVTQQELADRMGIARETVAQWERGEREISPQHDFILRGLVIGRASGEHSSRSAALLQKCIPILSAVKSAPPPRSKRAGELPPVSFSEYFPELLAG